MCRKEQERRSGAFRLETNPESSYSDLYILQSIKVNVDILNYYYNCKCM